GLLAVVLRPHPAGVGLLPESRREAGVGRALESVGRRSLAVACVEVAGQPVEPLVAGLRARRVAAASDAERPADAVGALIGCSCAIRRVDPEALPIAFVDPARVV